MDKAENDRESGQTFRGHSGWEAHDSVGADRSKKARFALSVGVIMGAMILFGVVFFVAPVGAKFNPKRPVAIRCVDNSKCAAAGLNGDCCPTPGPLGQTLACCTAEDNFITATLTAPGACDDNSACASMGLTGACCPTANGVKLACCFSQNNTARSQHPVSAQCSQNTACRRLNLDGNCCPNDAGATLGCCPPTTAMAKPQSQPNSISGRL